MEKKEREILKFSLFEIRPILDEWAIENYEEEYYDEDGNEISGPWLEFEKIEEEETCYSLEDGYADMKVIVQRKSDNKYFKGTYTYYNYENNEYDITLTEVFPKEKTIIIYE